MSVLERVRENQAIQGNSEPKGLRGTRLLSEMGPSVKEAVLERVGYEEAARIAGLSDPKRARSELRPAVDAVLNVLASDYQDGSDREELVAAVLDDIVGLGPLQPLLEDDSITEVMVNGPQAAFYERAGVLYPLERPFESEEQIRLVVDRIISPLGRRVDERSPMVNARLANGYRVNAVIPPIAIDGTLLTIRKVFRPHQHAGRTRSDRLSSGMVCDAAFVCRAIAGGPCGGRGDRIGKDDAAQCAIERDTDFGTHFDD